MEYREPEFLPWDGRRVPITFVGGYLGAGKTTAINELLSVTDRPIAVVVNDVGAINIDASLIRRRHGDTIELTNGCVCCSSIDELGAAFDLIRARPTAPDHVIVELSGVAELGRMLPWGQSAGFVLDGLVVIVAADQLLEGVLPRWVEDHLLTQIAAADLIVLTKTDLVDEQDVQRSRERLESLAPETAVLVGGRGAVEPGTIGRFLALGGRRPGGATAVPDATLFDAHDVHSVVAPAGLSVAEMRTWIESLGTVVGGRVVRAKGVVLTTDEGVVLVQVVGGRCELTALPPPEWQPPTDLVVISLAD